MFVFGKLFGRALVVRYPTLAQQLRDAADSHQWGPLRLYATAKLRRFGRVHPHPSGRTPGLGVHTHIHHLRPAASLGGPLGRTPQFLEGPFIYYC